MRAPLVITLEGDAPVPAPAHPVLIPAPETRVKNFTNPHGRWLLAYAAGPRVIFGRGVYFSHH